MNEKQKKFVREYLKDFNGTRAYKEAYGCSEESARRLASRLLTNVDIQQAIKKQADKQLEEIEIDVNYIISNIKEVTERCMEKKPVEYFDKIDKCWKDVTEYTELPNGEVVEARVMSFDARNSLKGLELLGKYKNIFTENVKLSGNVSHIEEQKNAVDDIIGQMKPLDEDDV